MTEELFGFLIIKSLLTCLGTHSWFDSRITSFAETIMNEMHDDDDDDEPN